MSDSMTLQWVYIDPGPHSTPQPTRYPEEFVVKRTCEWPADWGPWDEFTQYRRPHPMRVEFRRSVPAALLLGVLTMLSAFSLTFLGLWVPRQDLGTGLLIAAAGLMVFLLGRGIVIDGTRQIVRRWWGWLYRPVLSTEYDLSTIEAIEIRKILGPEVPEYGVGRTVALSPLPCQGRRPSDPGQALSLGV